MLREIKHILGRGDILIVEFTKKNGEKRKMKCTTSLDRHIIQRSLCACMIL